MSREEIEKRIEEIDLDIHNIHFWSDFLSAADHQKIDELKAERNKLYAQLKGENE